MDSTDLLTLLTTRRAFAVLRGDDPSALLDTAQVLRDNGITTVEVSLTSADALSVLSAVSALPGLVVGVGTVTTPAEAEAAVDAGARFLVSPVVAPDVADWARDHAVGLLAGAMTPTEVLAAWRAGASAVKVFPAAVAGGPAYIAALRGPLPEVPLIPVGGVELAEVPGYLAAGAVAVGIGGPLVGDPVRVGERAARLRALIEGAGDDR